MKLPVISGDQIIKLLIKEGFQVTRQKGSHISLHKRLEEGNMVLVVVPRKREIKKGTLLSIIKQSRIPRDEFLSRIK